MALSDDLKARFPNISPTLIDSYITVTEAIYRIYYNKEYGLNSVDDEIILNLIAHLIITEENTKDGYSLKDVSSESAGGVSVSYSNVQQNNEEVFFNSTIYGQRYLMLISRINKAYFV